MENPALWLRTICRKNGITPTDAQLQLLESYVSLLLEWNKKINLISRKDEAHVWQNHILHSIAPLFKLAFTRKSAVLDLGTGGGMPGIPLKIFLPDSEFVLLDSTRKKVLAVQNMVQELRLPGIRTVWGRAEELGRQENLMSHFDYIVARAVAPLVDLIQWSSPFAKPSSGAIAPSAEPPVVVPPALVALKGGDLDDELLNARRARGARVIDVIDLVFAGSEELAASDKKVVVVHF